MRQVKRSRSGAPLPRAAVYPTPSHYILPEETYLRGYADRVYSRRVKLHTIESAANSVRGILRPFSDGERVKIISLATRSFDDEIAVDERGDIERALEAAGGNVARAASTLGYSRRTLQKRMQRLGMPPGRDGRPPRKQPAP